MKRWQVLVLISMVILVIILFCGVAFFSRSLFTDVAPAVIAEGEATALIAVTSAIKPTATATIIPTQTLTPLPTDTPVPTATSTRVVVDTVTPTASNTPTITPIPTNTSTAVIKPAGSGGGGGGSTAAPTATPTSKYPFKYVSGPLRYETENHFLYILFRVTAGGNPVSGYKLVGTHSPTGYQWESDPSCPNLCKASGPESYTNPDGDEVKFQIQEANLVFESPAYDTGTWTLMLVDSYGQQVSDIFQLTLDGDKKEWFYYHYAQ